MATTTRDRPGFVPNKSSSPRRTQRTLRTERKALFENVQASRVLIFLRALRALRVLSDKYSGWLISQPNELSA